jgi:hypothetical protein
MPTLNSGNFLNLKYKLHKGSTKKPKGKTRQKISNEE